MADGITIKLSNEKQLKKWFGDWHTEAKRSKPLMFALATFYLQQIMRTFKGAGERDGFPKWIWFNRGKGHIFGGSTKTKAGTWNLRYGTDREPERTAAELKAYKTENNLWYKRGPMRGYRSQRRYSVSSIPLMASGNFRKSFRAILVSEKKTVVGSTMPNASKIARGRPIIRISARDRSNFSRLLIRHFIPKGSTT